MRLALLLLAGCSLTRNAPPVTVHYYDPLPAMQARTSTPVPPRARIRLGRIETSAHLRYAIAYRTKPLQLEVYDFERWSDTPDAYVERALGEALFSGRPLQEATDGEALVLDVTILAFEELRGVPERGLVRLHYRLRDEHSVIEARTITVMRTARSGALGDVVAAIGGALDEAAGRVADRALVNAVAHPRHVEASR